MKTNFEMVKEFHDKCLVVNREQPTTSSKQIQMLRLRLISEEFAELVEAMHSDDIVSIADALTDLLYVVYGSGAEFGIDLDKCFEEVHRSNMTKSHKEKNRGKVSKGADYEPPNLTKILFPNRNKS